MSAYKIETWLKRGYNEEEAKYQIAIRRPTNYLYWVNKGFTEEEAKKKVVEFSKNACAKNLERPSKDRRKDSHRCIEYYLHRGYTKDEGIRLISEKQRLFSKDICLEKYGVEEGTRIWQERQDKWQRTLKSKHEDEIKQINKRKNMKDIKNWINKYGIAEGKEKFRKFMLTTGMQVFENLEDLQKYLLETITPFDVYMPIRYFKKKYLKSYYFTFFDRPKNIDNWLKTFIDFKAPQGEIVFLRRTKKYPKGHYVMYVGSKLLRSSNEIYFYQLLCENGLTQDKDYEIEKYYPNSMKRCDFYFKKKDMYIELAGQQDEKYKQQMAFKASTYGAKILWKQEDYAEVIRNIVDESMYQGRSRFLCETS